MANRSAFMQKLQEEEAAANLARRAADAERARVASAEADEQEVQAMLKATRAACLLAKSREAHEAAANLHKLRAEIAAEEEAGRRKDALARRRLLVEAPAQEAEIQPPVQTQTEADAPLAAPPGTHNTDPRSTE
jgi:hypothetical protein